MRSCFLAALMGALAAGAGARADEVTFKNGDHLTGKIENVEGGKLILTSKVAGKVTVDLKDVKTFSSDGTIAIKLSDGTVINQKVSAGPDGTIALAPGGALAPQNVPVANIKYINFSDKWTGSITAGGALTRGNTSTETLNLAVDMVRRTENDRFTIDAGFLYGRQKDQSTKATTETENDWFIGGKYDYFFTPQLYGYANARVERDLIAGVSLRLTPGGGVGYQWIDQPDFHLQTEGGISWLYREYTHNGGTSETVAARAAYHVDKKLSPGVAVFHNFEYYPGLDTINDYFFDTDAGIRADLTDKMFTEFKAIEKYDSQPAPGKGHNDTQFVLSVGLNF